MLSQQPRYQRPSLRHLISCLSRQKSLGLRLEPQDRDIPILGYLNRLNFRLQRWLQQVRIYCNILSFVKNIGLKTVENGEKFVG